MDAQTAARSNVLTATTPLQTTPGLSVVRLNLMRVGYAVMGFGLAAAKWPLLDDLRHMPVFEGVMTCLFVALGLLALLGLRQPARMLPVLVFDVLWKAIWLTLVALPEAVTGSLSEDVRQVAVNCSVVAIVVLVTPWSHVWHRLISGPADPWR